MKCEQFQLFLDGYVDNDLSEEAFVAIQKHILTCSECSFEIKSLEQIRAFTRSAHAESEPVSPSFRERTVAKLLDSLDEIQRPSPLASTFQRSLPLY